MKDVIDMLILNKNLIFKSVSGLLNKLTNDKENKADDKNRLFNPSKIIFYKSNINLEHMNMMANIDLLEKHQGLLYIKNLEKNIDYEPIDFSEYKNNYFEPGEYEYINKYIKTAIYNDLKYYFNHADRISQDILNNIVLSSEHKSPKVILADVIDYIEFIFQLAYKQDTLYDEYNKLKQP